MKRLLFVVSLLFTFAFSRQAPATCSANLSATVTGTTLNVSASGGGTRSVACLHSGPHTVTLGVSCGRNVTQNNTTSCAGDNGNSTQTFTLNVQPSGDISFTPDATGNGNVMVKYSFPGTDAAVQRTVDRSFEVNINGHFISAGVIHPELASGTWSIP